MPSVFQLRRFATSPITATSLISLVVGLLGGMLLSGCPDPRNDLVFESSGERVREVAVHLDEGGSLRLRGWGVYEGEYELSLFFRVQLDSPADSLVFRPEMLSVLYNGERMTFEDTVTSRYDHNPAKGKYAYLARFNCLSMLESLPRDEVGNIQDVPITIQCDRAFSIRGNPISAEVLHAWEVKAKDQETVSE